MPTNRSAPRGCPRAEPCAPQHRAHARPPAFPTPCRSLGFARTYAHPACAAAADLARHRHPCRSTNMPRRYASRVWLGIRGTHRPTGCDRRLLILGIGALGISQRLNDANPSGAWAGLEPQRLALRVELAQLVDVVNCRLGLFDLALADVRAEDLHATRRGRAELLVAVDRDGVGFLTAGSGSGPDPNLLRRKAREDVLMKKALAADHRSLRRRRAVTSRSPRAPSHA